MSESRSWVKTLRLRIRARPDESKGFKTKEMGPREILEAQVRLGVES